MPSRIMNRNKQNGLIEFLDKWTNPPGLTSEDGIRYWQDRLLFTILLVGSVIGLIVVVPSILLSIKEELWIIAVADVVIYSWVVILFVKKSLAFEVRAVTTTLISYLLGMILLLTIGPFGAGPVWLFVFPVFAGLLLGIRLALIALSVNAVTMVILGLLISSGFMHWDYAVINATERWIVISLNFMLMNSMVAISISIISRELQNLLEQKRSMLISMEENHNKLLESSHQLEIEMRDRELAEEDRTKLEDQLRQVQKMEAIGTLAGGIAHDFNNILTPLIGYSELILSSIERGTQTENHIREVLKASNRAKDLVQQILAFSRRKKQELKPVMINLVAREVIKLVRSSIPTTIEISQNLVSDSLILGDPTQIHQVLMNLFTNAAHAMEDSGGTLSVDLNDIKLDESFTSNYPDLEPGEYIKLVVSDTGIGIPPQIMQSIFDPYFTTKEPGEGTGLGLPVVLGIIKGYGGEITVESEHGNGSTFIVYLPVVNNAVGIETVEKEILPTGNENILLIDDERPIVEMCESMLNQLGYTVTSSTSSIDALKLFSEGPDDFDLVITDMTMPVMTGDILAIEIMKIRPDIPVILCTGYSRKISANGISEIGIKAYVEKPFVLKELAKTIRQVFEENRD